MSNEDELALLKRDRGVLKSRLTRFAKYMSEETHHQDLTQIKLRIENIEGILKEFEIKQNKIVALTGVEGNELEDFEFVYNEEMTRAHTILYGPTRQITNRNSSNDQISENSNCHAMPSTFSVDQTSVRLPRIELISFNGAFDKWLEFHDSFKSMVHNNIKLADIQKLLYLRSCLKDEAASVINSLETSAENYSVAWELLKTRFDNRRVIIQNHLKAFVELPNMVKESTSELRKLLDQIQTHLRALKALGESVEHWDTIVIYSITLKIDRISHKEWEKSLTGTTIPKLDTFIAFLENRSHILQTTAFSAPTSYNSNNSNNVKKSNFTTNNKRQAFTSANAVNCIVCQGSHKLFACEQFRKLSVSERVEIIKSNNFCFNCLNIVHRNDDCRWQGFKKCGRKHNTLLHFDKNESHSSQNHESNETEKSNNGAASSSIKAHNATIPSQILLSTALIYVKNKRGEKIEAQIILDNGSQSNFMTTKFAKSLDLPSKKINVPVEGLNQLQTRIKESLNATIFSKQSNYNANLEFLILPRICDYLPSQFIDKQDVSIPHNIKLADPEFNKPREIDALLGVETFYELLCVGQIQLDGHRAKITKTKLGWIISGKIGTDMNPIKSKQTLLSIDSLHKEISKFWEIEEFKEERFLSEEESQVETFYNETTRKDSISGKYIVRLPFNDKISMLGDSYHTAKRRYETLERKLAQNADMKAEYDKFMREYIDLGHMSETLESAKHKGYFMPHHAVVKESSETTKLRVVFDASAKTSSGISLNNCLKVGPTLQQDIFSIIVRFRTHQYALTTDIEKMYRQILVDEWDTPYQ